MLARAFVAGLLGWGIPALVAVPLGTAHEAAGGESAILFGAVWLFVLGPIGCFIAGLWVARAGRRAGRLDYAFWTGLAATCLALALIVLVDAAVTVLTIGSAAIVLMVPLVLAYSLGFGVGLIATRAAQPSPDENDHRAT